MKSKNIRVIFDTNVWISFLIGKQLATLRQQIVNERVTIITTSQLFAEIIEVTSREKLRKYFPSTKVLELISLLKLIGEDFRIQPTYFIVRDKKDNFLLDLIDVSKADFLVTGDKDLLDLHKFKTAKIISPTDFEELI